MNTKYLETAFLNPTIKNVDELIKYLQTIGGKALTVYCKRQYAFKIEWKKSEQKLISRCHVQNATDYLKFIKGQYTDRQIKVVIADIADYVNYLDSNEDASFILLSANTLPSAMHFDSATRLFFTHQIRDQNQNNYNTDLLVIYSLRLALERRIMGLLGIDRVTNKGKIVGLSKFIRICKELKSVNYSVDVNWIEIEWINDWINHHMHRHLRPHPWIIFQAIEALKSFINPKVPFETINGKVYSIYSATCVVNEQELHIEIESALKKLCPEIKIEWLGSREILKVEIN